MGHAVGANGTGGERRTTATVRVTTPRRFSVFSLRPTLHTFGLICGMWRAGIQKAEGRAEVSWYEGRAGRL